MKKPFTPSLAVASVIQPKAPTGRGWELNTHLAPRLPIDGAYECWLHPGSDLFVISAVEVASEAPGMPSLGPAYHLSVSQHGRRCTSADAQWVLGQFDLTDAREDNHVPSGRVRNFWRYVADHLSGIECPCTATEPVMREDKGDYVWRGPGL